MMNKKSVCLIVDNPLRDLNGLILLAYFLARRNLDVWLVPMYEQWAEINAIRPDAVMVNYIRGNNRNHVISYLRSGMTVGVLETEGVGGRSIAEYRQLVSTTGCARFLDLYCFWGRKQSAALIEGGVISASIAAVTGCPRYDFCAPPWRQMLERRIREPYVLINTSFPSVNPRFSAGAGAEIEAMISAGFSKDFAEEYIAAARSAISGIIDLLRKLLVEFPDRHFVLRPHPFESPDGYRALYGFRNLEIRQEGTSLEWVAHADVLIHLNCSTAVEASMLAVPAVSPAWLDAPPLHVPLVSELSRNYSSDADFINALREMLDSRGSRDAVPVSDEVERYYSSIDGMSAIRAADAIVATLSAKSGDVPKKGLPRVPHRFRIKAAVRSLLGRWLRWILAGRRRKISAKSFTLEQVNTVLNSISPLDRANLAAGGVTAGTSPGKSSVLVRIS